ncbi:hypothetical protein HPP92_020530 [Vanilla planifolia]|uniref:Pentatricopeptide repeat-containing protein n=1 Tax=Vanilla planifolia TaxID=51239 RepID=A0A835UGC6_VANPL|nr:hypothetical protein HPP92_020920 [Vanilla planifolia]KAG0462054.1 hypothetical protein HPP92_020530 [Vanilla planifolia]
MAGDGEMWSLEEKQCFLLLQRISSLPSSSRHLSSILQIHAFVLRRFLDGNVPLLTLLISSLSFVSTAVSGTIKATSAAALRHACRTFACRPAQDAFLCNSMIRALSLNNHHPEAIALYRDLRRSPPPQASPDFRPDSYTFPFLLKSCAAMPNSAEQKEGLQLHAHVTRMGFVSNVFVSTGLVDMYVKSGDLESARKAFDEMPETSPASWTAITVGYARSGDARASIEMFQLMPQKDTAAFNAMINIFVKSGDMCSAHSLFDEVPKKNVVSWTTLLSGYCKIGDMVSARKLFDEMTERNLYSWNTMIGGYTQNQQPHEALDLFRRLQSNDHLFSPDEVTMVSVIPAVADMGALDLGRWIHSYARRKGLDRISTVSTALIDMYAKCGEMAEARKVFKSLLVKETASWNSLINGLAVNGQAREALDVFMEMQHSRFRPNGVTMVGVLAACSHGGLVEEGRRWFKEMEGLGIEKNIAHHGCFVDLLGRGGFLEEAESVVKSMPSGPNGIILSSLLFACLRHRDVLRAERVMEMAAEAEPGNVRNYVMMRNLYAAEKRWVDVENVKGLMRRFGGKEETGCSAIEVEGRFGSLLLGM